MSAPLPFECHGFGLRSAYLAARSASKVLMLWLTDTYDLDASVLDRERALTPAALRQVKDEGRFLGFDITDAPPLPLLAMRVYFDLVTFDHADRLAPAALTRHRSGENAVLEVALPDLSRTMQHGIG